MGPGLRRDDGNYLAAQCVRGLRRRCPSKEKEGAGNAGCTLHPRSHVPNCAKETHMSIQVQSEALRHSLRNGFTAYGALSPATNSSCHRHWRIKVLCARLGLQKTSADLTPATGARTTRFCRTQPPVIANRLRPKPDFDGSRKAQRALAPSSCASDTAHGINPPCALGFTPTLPRPPHPVPTFVTMANAPLLGDETARLIVLICPTGEAEYFFGEVWTGQITLKDFGKLVFWRNGVGAGLMGR
jgi:hypothetical protein